MSASTDTHADHHPHITPLWVYFAVISTLLFLTVVTVAVAQVDLGEVMNLIVAMAVATVKASLVAFIFMHLLFDNKFYTYLLVASLVFLSVFITFCLFDTMRRHEVRPEVAKPIAVEADMYTELRAIAAEGHHAEHGDGEHADEDSHDGHGTEAGGAHAPAAAPASGDSAPAH